MNPQRQRPAIPEIRKEVLANGLELYLVEDRSSPLVTFQIWYRVGSAHEQEHRAGRPGFTGLSHFLEHMLFRGTARYPDCFQAVYARGGQLNAWTWYDATCFWAKLPAGNLSFLFSLEADRLQNLRLDLLAFEQEREVVRNERLLRLVNDPSGALDEKLHARAFQHSPYRWPVLGWPQDLIAVSVQQAREYFHRHYSPSNAMLVIVGDFDPTEALALAEQEFGGLPARRPPPRAPAAEPPQQAERRDFLEKATATGLFQMAYQAPAAADPDFLPFEVLHFLLACGKSSRLQRQLIYGRDAVAGRVSASLWALGEPYLYQLEVQVAPGRSNREAEQRIDEVLDELRSRPVEPGELRKAVNGMRSELVRACLETQGKANLIGFSLLTTGRPDTFFSRLVEAEQISPADLQRVARRWLVPARRTVVAAVSPGRLGELVRERWPGGPADPAAPAERRLLLQALELARLRQDLSQEHSLLDEEAAAVAQLHERLQQEALRLEQQPQAGEELRALAQFRDRATKGVEQRRQALALALERLQARQAAAAERTIGLLGELTALEEAGATPTGAPDCGAAPPAAAPACPPPSRPSSLLLALVRAALGEGPLPAATELALLAPGEDAALLLLLQAQLAWRTGRAEAAQAALHAVLGLERGPMDDHPLLRRAADLAWEYRVA